MVVMILEKVPPSLRGELTRWLLEITPGVFAGRVSATVRDLLWAKATERGTNGRCYLVFRAANEQGFALRASGDSNRSIIDADGLALIAVKNARWEQFMAERAAPENLDSSDT